MQENATTESIIERNQKAGSFLKTFLAAVCVYHRHNVRFSSEQDIPSQATCAIWRLQCVRILAFERFTEKVPLIIPLQ